MCYFLYVLLPEKHLLSSARMVWRAILECLSVCVSGTCGIQGVVEILADEFPWHGFLIVPKSMLKICCVGHVKAPLLPFPLLKVPLAHQVIFSFWLENCWAYWKPRGVPWVFSIGETYILLLGSFWTSLCKVKEVWECNVYLFWSLSGSCLSMNSKCLNKKEKLSSRVLI